jgi:hypothetical protein
MTKRTLVELALGVLWATGAAAQAFDTLRNSEKFYTEMANLAWIRPARLLIEEVLLPNSVAVTVLVVVFQASVAIAIFTRMAAVGPALVAGGVFSIVGALTASPVATASYLILAAVHFALAQHRKREQTVP